MKLQFYDFILDTDRQTLFHSKTEIEITKINYQVLLYFVEHQNQVVTKDQLIDNIWQDKMVTENSIDQSLSKIRKSLAKYDDRVIIKTVFGKGLEFTAPVEKIDTSSTDIHSKINKSKSLFLVIAGLLVIFSTGYYGSHILSETKANNQPPILILNNNNNSDWLNLSSRQLFNQLFSNSQYNHLIDNDSKPDQLSQSEYISNYWRINPNLEVVLTEVSENDTGYTLTVKISKKQGDVSETFQDKELTTLLTKANKWLVSNSSLRDTNNEFEYLLPEDSHVLELYMRGLDSLDKGELEQALNYTKLAKDQEPEFILAQLQLADIQSRKGDNQQAVEILDRLKNMPHYSKVQLSAEMLRADILDTAGEYQKAIETYQHLIANYGQQNPKKILAVKYNLSFSLASELKYEQALTQLDDILIALQDHSDPKFMADILHKKGSILLQIGRTAEARELANKAFKQYNDLSDLMGSAIVNILLARIANHESDYDNATYFLKQSINIYRHANYPLGVGATLNELIYTLMVSGQFDEAWTHMLEMKQIAMDIDYFAMLMAAKQFEIEISRARKQWAQAEAGLDDYLKLSTEENFTRGLFKHKLFGLDLALDQEQPTRAQNYIDQIQEHIDKSGENRLQPRLNFQQARLYFLQDKDAKALQLLNENKASALATDDMETIHEINNELLRHYIKSGDYEAAQKIITAIDKNPNKPLDYPYLLLKSKILYGLGHKQQALNLAESSKAQAHEFWQAADEQYLKSLSN